MKKLIVLLALAFTLALVPAGTAQAKKPLRYECEGWATGFGWEGIITSGDLTGATGIWVTLVVDFNRGEGPPIAVNVYFFEKWFIGFDIEYVPPPEDGEWGISGDVVLAGFDEGVTRFSNGKFNGNGRVTEAYGDWSGLIGCKERISGTVDFSDLTFTGTVLIY